MTKKLFLILTPFFVLALFAIAGLFYLNINKIPQLEIDYFDVGQGDAILIKSPAGQNILIDGGQNSLVLKKMGKNLPWWDRTIDLVILTHPHDDHVGGLIDVLKRYKVKKIIYTGVVHNSPSYIEFLKIVRDKKIIVTIISKAQLINLGEEAKLEIIWPRSALFGQSVSNLNNSSIITRLIYKNKKYLFTGDAENEVEKELADNNIDLSADILKVGHHGSDTATSQDFLDKVRPSIAIISVGKNNFGLPSGRIISRLERAGAKIYRNDTSGTIKITSNGQDINIKSQN